MSRFGNKITLDEVILGLEATEQKIPLLGEDVRRKRKRGGIEAHDKECRTRFESACRRGTIGMGLSRKLSKRQCRPGSSDPPNEAQSKNTLCRLRRAMTRMKEVERRVEEMMSSSAAVKLEIARMRDEAIRAREEAFIARDEGHQLRDEAEGLKAEASITKVDACRMREEAAAFHDEAAPFRDEAECIYVDVAAVKVDYKRDQGGYPFEGDETRILWTDSSNWSDEDYL